MKISCNWLKKYIDLSITPEEIAERLTLLGLEVEEMEQIGSDLEGVVVGEVLEATSHPNADKLKLCSVNIGKEEPVQIVCGAPNVAGGQKVPVATVNTTLPIVLPNGKPFKIKKSKIRGEVSFGMICAEDELGIGDNHSGIMVLDTNKPNGTPFNEVADLYHDTVLEIAITPNRPDATCHIGVARDLAAYFEKELRYPQITSADDQPVDGIKISIKDEDKCHRYVGKVIKNATIKESPAWLKNYLTAIGLRPVNNAVDVTNFVLHEMGQPLHAFDLDEVAGQEIIVQSFDKEIEFETLDEIKRKVPAGSLFICDAEKPVAIAGVMGGQNSEISEKTTNILIESAYFEPTSIRTTSKALALQTDASYRFERGIDPEMTRKAAERCAEILAQLTDGEIVDGTTDVHPVKFEQKTVTLRPERFNKLMGTDLKKDHMLGILNRLEIPTENKDGVLVSEIPSFRPDIEREVDLIEEVARVYDYNNVQSPTLTHFHTPSPFPEQEQFIRQQRRFLAQSGFREIYTNSLLPESYAEKHSNTKELIKTLNPISRDQSVLRDSLSHGFLSSVEYNVNRSQDRIAFYEVGHVYSKDRPSTFIDGVGEEVSLLLGYAGFKQPEHWTGKKQPYTIFDIKTNIEAWFRALGLNAVRVQAPDNENLEYYVGKSLIGSAHIFNPDINKAFDIEVPVVWAEFNLTEIQTYAGAVTDKIKPVPKFPSFDFDLAVTVDKDIRAGDLMDQAKKSAGKQLISINVFDVYEGENIGKDKKSIAFRLLFRDESKTLTIKDVEPLVDNILKSLSKQFDAELRG